MIAEVPPQLSAGIRNTVRPMPRFRIEQNTRRLYAGSSHHHGPAIHFDLLLCLSVNVRHALGHAVLIYENVLSERIRPQFKVLGRLRLRQKTPRCREERSGIASRRAGAAKVASWMSLMLLR